MTGPLAAQGRDRHRCRTGRGPKASPRRSPTTARRSRSSGARCRSSRRGRGGHRGARRDGGRRSAATSDRPTRSTPRSTHVVARFGTVDILVNAAHHNTRGGAAARRRRRRRRPALAHRTAGDTPVHACVSPAPRGRRQHRELRVGRAVRARGLRRLRGERRTRSRRSPVRGGGGVGTRRHPRQRHRARTSRRRRWRRRSPTRRGARGRSGEHSDRALRPARRHRPCRRVPRRPRRRASSPARRCSSTAGCSTTADANGPAAPARGERAERTPGIPARRERASVISSGLGWRRGRCRCCRCSGSRRTRTSATSARDAGSARNACTDFVVVEERLLGLGEVPGDVALALVQVHVLALAARARLKLAGPVIVRVPPAQRRAARRDLALGHRDRLERRHALAVVRRPRALPRAGTASSVFLVRFGPGEVDARVEPAEVGRRAVPPRALVGAPEPLERRGSDVGLPPLRRGGTRPGRTRATTRPGRTGRTRMSRSCTGYDGDDDLGEPLLLLHHLRRGAATEWLANMMRL